MACSLLRRFGRKPALPKAWYWDGNAVSLVGMGAQGRFVNKVGKVKCQVGGQVAIVICSGF